MLKYTLLGDNDYIFDPIGEIFANRGIKDVESFINPSESLINHYSLLKNIDKAVKCLVRHLETNSNIFIVIDPDVDGYCSASIIYQYIKLLDSNANVNWVVRNDKKHGIEGIDIPKQTNLLILPDSGSNDYDQHKKLNGNGIDIIVLDHHEADEESKYAIVVNHQLDNYPNKTLSGAGIVLKFCEALDDYFNVEYSTQFHDLVALGIIADSMVLSDLETRYYIKSGLSEIDNDFFNALLHKQEFSTKGKINITTINFYISPLINSVIRVSDIQEKIDMFKSFIGVKELVKYKPRGSDEILVPLVDDMARRCVNARSKQNRIRDKIVEKIDEFIIENNLKDNKVIFVHDISFEEENVTGLVSNVIAGKYKRPTIIVSKVNKDGLGKGSARGYDKGGITNFKDIVVNSGLFEMAAGHQGAFGIRIKKENFDKVDEVLNNLLANYDISNQYNIDFDIKSDILNNDIIHAISELEDEWGKGFEEPYILIRDIPVDKADINLKGQKENTISIKYKEIEYMIFKTNKNVFDNILESNDISVIGKAKINRYNDIETSQIFVDSFELK